MAMPPAVAICDSSFRPSEARAGIQWIPREAATLLDSRSRGNDEEGKTPDYCQ